MLLLLLFISSLIIRKIISNIILQPLHEIYYDGTSVWTEEKSYTFAVSILFAFHLVALLFFSVCIECPGRKIDILIFSFSLCKHAYPGMSLRAVTCSTCYS